MNPIEPETSGRGRRVIVAMSGGVDSSVAAALLVEAGYEVVGISLRLADLRETGGPTDRSHGCCSLEDFRDAERVAATLGIAHYVFDLREEFGRAVVDPFVAEYREGRTPSPCILCNREIKFGVLLRKAAELGAEAVATGHYARRVWSEGRHRLLRARDLAKDQSYFLFELGQKEMARTLFPVGDLEKPEVRQVARRLGLAVAEKPESQEICFVAGKGYAEFVEARMQGAPAAGDFRDGEGRAVGRHRGIHHFTIGQRRGLGIAASEPLYVTSIDAPTATVRVGPRRALLRAGLEVDRVAWTSGVAEPEGAEVMVRVRHRHQPTAATVWPAQAGRLEVRFAEPQASIAPGQAAVFYRGDEVLGGGWIEKSLEMEEARSCA
jgi:tRNA-specific 2-thiouridylase